MYVCIKYVCVYMYVLCMCVCMYVCVCVYVCIKYVCVYMYVYMYVLCMCVYVCMYVYVCVYVCIKYVCVYMYVYMCVCMYVCVCMYACMIIQYMSRPPCCLFYTRSPTTVCVHSRASDACCIPCAAQSTWFHHLHNIWWRVQSTKIIIQFSPVFSLLELYNMNPGRDPVVVTGTLVCSWYIEEQFEATSVIQSHPAASHWTLHNVSNW
jgi:nuclear pore complex protein Nup62